jgi:hypothetical protein
MPDGSSSAAPVISPGPRFAKNRLNSGSSLLAWGTATLGVMVLNAAARLRTLTAPAGANNTLSLVTRPVSGREGGMDEDLKVELERLRAENERLKNRSSRGVSLKVSEKGGVSVYGLGRFPVTLYKEQWTRLLDMADDIRAFIRENDTRLKAKAD